MSKTKKSLVLPSVLRAGDMAGFGSRDTRVGRRAAKTPATGGRRGCVMEKGLESRNGWFRCFDMEAQYEY
jgi:hypothetical protein